MISDMVWEIDADVSEPSLKIVPVVDEHAEVKNALPISFEK